MNCAAHQSHLAKGERDPSGRCLGETCRKYQRELALLDPWALDKILAKQELLIRSEPCSYDFQHPLKTVPYRRTFRESLPGDVIRDMKREGFLPAKG